MAKISVIYRAPKGDSRVTEWLGFTFFDGMPVEIEDNEDNAHLIGKLMAAKSPMFEVSEMVPFEEMRTGTPFYPRAVAEETEEESSSKVAFEGDYVPIEDAMIKRKRGRPKKYRERR